MKRFAVMDKKQFPTEIHALRFCPDVTKTRLKRRDPFYKYRVLPLSGRLKQNGFPAVSARLLGGVAHLMAHKRFTDIGKDLRVFAL